MLLCKVWSVLLLLIISGPGQGIGQVLNGHLTRMGSFALAWAKPFYHFFSSLLCKRVFFFCSLRSIAHILNCSNHPCKTLERCTHKSSSRVQCGLWKPTPRGSRILSGRQQIPRKARGGEEEDPRGRALVPATPSRGGKLAFFWSIPQLCSEGGCGLRWRRAGDPHGWRCTRGLGEWREEVRGSLIARNRHRGRLQKGDKEGDPA